MEALQTILGDVGIIGLVGALVWLIRLEGVVKRNREEIDRLSHLEEQAQSQEVRIKQRDEEMRAIKHSLDELKERVTKVETNQTHTGEALVRIETKLDIILENRGG
jgi:chaperonin cofactor prefoldin